MDSFSISSSFFVLPSPQKNSYLLNSPTRSPQIRQTDANDNTTSLSSPFSPVLSPTKHLSSPGKCSSSPTKKQSFSTKSSPSKKHGSKIGKSDRFIGSRSGIETEVSQFLLRKENKSNGCGNAIMTTPAKEEYKTLLAETLFYGNLTPGSSDSNLGPGLNGNGTSGSPTQPSGPRKQRVVTPSAKHDSVSLTGCPVYPQSDVKPWACPVRELFTASLKSQVAGLVPRKIERQIPSEPERILDAPNLVDDYYLNLLDWSCTYNVVAIALGKSVFLWNAESKDICELVTQSPDYNIVTSLSFEKSSSLLAVGTNEAEVQIWDIGAQKLLRRMAGHNSRVGSLDWNTQHPYLLSSGSRDSTVIHHDIRQAQHVVKQLENHTQEVCGLRWSLDGTTLASGGNDNLLTIWDLHRNEPRFVSDRHQAAVKALAWCPFQSNLLASGGGTADRNIKLWNTSTGVCINSIDTKSQVCSLVWSTHYKELLSSHGFSQNQLIVWKYPSMTKLTELKGHSARVLHMARSPDGKTVASAAGDETLRFWKVFDVEEKSESSQLTDLPHSPNSSKFSSPFSTSRNLRLR